MKKEKEKVKNCGPQLLCQTSYLPKSGHKSQTDDSVTMVVVGGCVFQEREAVELEISQKRRLLPTALTFSLESSLRNLYFDILSSADYCTNAGAAAAAAAHPEVR